MIQDFGVLTMIVWVVGIIPYGVYLRRQNPPQDRMDTSVDMFLSVLWPFHFAGRMVGSAWSLVEDGISTKIDRDISK